MMLQTQRRFARPDAADHALRAGEVARAAKRHDAARVRLMLNRQRTQISNALRAHLSDFGIVAPIGRNGIEKLLMVVNDDNDTRIPADARLCLRMLEAQLRVVKQQILENDRRVRASARETELGCRLMEIPGVGLLVASAFVATIADPHAFKSARLSSAQCRSSAMPSETGPRGHGSCN